MTCFGDATSDAFLLRLALTPTDALVGSESSCPAKAVAIVLKPLGLMALPAPRARLLPVAAAPR